MSRKRSPAQRPPPPLLQWVVSQPVAPVVPQSLWGDVVVRAVLAVLVLVLVLVLEAELCQQHHRGRQLCLQTAQAPNGRRS